jgi:hypothetical protein
VSRDAALASVDVEDARRLTAVFRAWAGRDANLQVVFTPDVLIGVADDGARGYLFDDAWTVECWIEDGVPSFVELVEAEFADRAEDVLDPGGTSRSARARQQLMALVAERGVPIAEVRHLL